VLSVDNKINVVVGTNLRRSEYFRQFVLKKHYLRELFTGGGEIPQGGVDG
jgi:hypothetical protein